MSVPTHSDTLEIHHVETGVPPPVSRIKALPTKFLGTTYRSRLEARWACALHALEVAFDYEPEGFQLESGTKYLPDLYFPHIRWFAEVKPFPLSDIERAKCLEMVKGTGRPMILLVGPPAFKTYEVLRRVDLEEGDAPIIESFDCLLDIYIHGLRLYRDQKRLFCDCDGRFKEREDFSLRYQEAVDWSLDIRFDESGRW